VRRDIAQTMLGPLKEVHFVKHVRQMSKTIPAPAAPWQDALCLILGAVVDIANLKESPIPFLSFFTEKEGCSTPIEDPPDPS
jgi:hypothetical protein